MDATLKANLQADELRSRLFSLIRDFRDLQIKLNRTPGDAAYEAHGQVDIAAGRLAEVYDGLLDFFIDAHRDDKNQHFAIEITEDL